MNRVPPVEAISLRPLMPTLNTRPEDGLHDSRNHIDIPLDTSLPAIEPETFELNRKDLWP